MTITDLTIEQKKDLIQKNGGRKENILGILLDLQYASPEGYVNAETVALVAEELEMTETRVYEIASYYAMLQVKPQARCVLEVCNSSPCHFSKSDKVVEMLEKELGVGLGETTPDGMFVFHFTPCVGACEIGPVIKFRDDVYGDLTEDKVKVLVQNLRKDYT